MEDFEVLDFSCYDDNAIEKYKDMGRECKRTTMEMYPYKFTVDVFLEEIERYLNEFAKNVKQIDNISTYNWAEDWMGYFQAWLEMEKGGFD